jgi:steroid delta-isomerase-like uncharacterized protein
VNSLSELARRISPAIAALLLCLAAGCEKQPADLVSEEQARAIADIYVQARNTPDLSLLDQIYGPDVVVHDPGEPEAMVGLEALKNQYNTSHTAFPDLHMTLDEMYIDGDRIFWVWTFTGTNTGPLGKLPATGNKISFTGVAIDRIVDGTIAEEWVYWNVLALYRQLGFTLVPPEPKK